MSNLKVEKREADEHAIGTVGKEIQLMRDKVTNALKNWWGLFNAHRIEVVTYEDNVLDVDGQRLPRDRIKAIEVRHKYGRTEERDLMQVFVWVAKAPDSLALVHDDTEIREMGVLEPGSNLNEKLEKIASDAEVRFIAA
jgi:hypothetical protein